MSGILTLSQRTIGRNELRLEVGAKKKKKDEPITLVSYHSTINITVQLLSGGETKK